MTSNADGTTGNSHGVYRGRPIRGTVQYESDLRFVVQQLEGYFDKFQRLFRKLDHGPSEQTYQELAALKRSVLERTVGLFQSIWPLLIELEFWYPGLSTEFHQLWLDEPAFNQGAASWLAYFGRLRGLLCEAMRAASTRTTGSTASTDDSFENRRPSEPLQPHPFAPVSNVERHFTPKELATQWGLDQSTVRRLFRDEEGVLRIPHLRRRGKRDYVSLRIPASVAARVHERRSRRLFRV